MPNTEPDTAADQPEKSPAPANNKPVMDVRVYAPFKEYFEGKAYCVTAVNETGPFDILPKHRNFLTMLTPCDLVVQSLDGNKTIKVTRALMYVKADRVVVFMDV